MKRLNEEVAVDIDEVQLAELEEAWRTKDPGHMWLTDRDGPPPLNEILTNDAKQEYINEGMYPEEVNLWELTVDDVNWDRFDPMENDGPVDHDEMAKVDELIAKSQRVAKMVSSGRIQSDVD